MGKTLVKARVEKHRKTMNQAGRSTHDGRSLQKEEHPQTMLAGYNFVGRHCLTAAGLVPQQYIWTIEAGPLMTLIFWSKLCKHGTILDHFSTMTGMSEAISKTQITFKDEAPEAHSNFLLPPLLHIQHVTNQ